MKSNIFQFCQESLKTTQEKQNLSRRVSTRHLKVIPIQDLEPKIGQTNFKKWQIPQKSVTHSDGSC